MILVDHELDIRHHTGRRPPKSSHNRSGNARDVPAIQGVAGVTGITGLAGGAT